MSKTVLSILLFVLGLIIGLVIVKVFGLLKNKTNVKKAETIIDNAKKEADKIKRIGSLNQLGYYLFIVKLTVYLMRKEDSDTLTERNIGFAY